MRQRIILPTMNGRCLSVFMDQEAPDWIVAHLNVRDEHRSRTPDMVERALRELFGEPIRLDVRLTTELERGRTGKLRCPARVCAS